METVLGNQNSLKTLAVIPARYASTRFPGKPLAIIGGKPMIQHVWERVQECGEVDAVQVATDDDRIAQVARMFGAKVCMTCPEHPSGTDRVWEVAEQAPGFDLVLNVQGDEPFINPQYLGQLIRHAKQHPEAEIVTLVTPIQGRDEWENPNVVKAVLAEGGRALYFSRAKVPYPRDAVASELLDQRHAFRHLGIYLFRREALARYTHLAPSMLEQMEKLEQLRALEAGMRIDAVTVDSAPIGVDTPEDLEALLALGSHG